MHILYTCLTIDCVLKLSFSFSKICRLILKTLAKVSWRLRRSVENFFTFIYSSFRFKICLHIIQHTYFCVCLFLQIYMSWSSIPTSVDILLCDFLKLLVVTLCVYPFSFAWFYNWFVWILNIFKMVRKIFN